MSNVIEKDADVLALIKRVFGNDDGQRLLKHLFEKNVNTTIATSDSLLEIGKRQGKSDLIRNLMKHAGETK